MRTFSCLLPAAAALLTCSCGDLLSLHSLYTFQDQVFDQALEGRWESVDNLMSIKRDGDHYEVISQARTPPTEMTKWEAHFVEIRGVRFADILPEDRIGHMIVRVRVSTTEMKIAFMDSEWLRQHVPHDNADIEGNRQQAVLTYRTPQLKSMVSKYALEERAYDKEIVFKRK